MEGAIKVAFHGAPGCFSEAAAQKIFAHEFRGVSKESFEDAFQAVAVGEADRAVVPIENSLGGSIHANYDFLLRFYKSLYIVAELDFRVQHCLMAMTGVERSQINKVMSHPQALAQCDDYIRKNGFKRVPGNDTASSAKLVASKGEKMNDTAAIASELAAQKYGLQILEKGIEDDKCNYTRFLVLSRNYQEPPTSVPIKTSIVFSVVEQPGVLFKALSVFALRDIDLTKIESRPGRRYMLKELYKIEETTNSSFILINHKLTKLEQDTSHDNPSSPYHTIFYLDFLASLAEERTKNALRHLSEIAPFIRVLGSYPTRGRHVLDEDPQ